MDPAALAQYVTLGTSAVSSGTGLLGGILANRANAKENQKNREWNEKMWHMTNEYNLPINVYQREMQGLAANGLNPNLAYGNMGQSLASYAGNLGTQKAYDNPAKDFKLDATDAFRLKNETEVANSTVTVNETQANKNNQDANLAKEQAEKTGWENIITSQTYENTIQSSLENLEILKNNNLISQEQYKIKQQEYQEQLEVVRQAKAAADVEEEKVNTQVETTKNLKQSTSTLAAQARYYDASAYLAKADAIKALEEASTQKAMREKLRSDSLLNKANIAYLRKQGCKTDAEAQKILIEAYNAFKNGEVDRFLKTGPQRFGTSNTGAVAGIIMDELGINPGIEPVGPYTIHKVTGMYPNQIFKPIKNSISRSVRPIRKQYKHKRK